MQRLIVTVNMPYLREVYGHESLRDLVYGWSGKPLEVGDRVRIPPTPLMPNESYIGVVVSTDASSSEDTGPVKELLGKIPRT